MKKNKQLILEDNISKVIEMRSIHGMEYREIAKIFLCSKDLVRLFCDKHEIHKKGEEPKRPEKTINLLSRKWDGGLNLCAI